MSEACDIGSGVDDIEDIMGLGDLVPNDRFNNKVGSRGESREERGVVFSCPRRRTEVHSLNVDNTVFSWCTAEFLLRVERTP